MTVIVYVPVGVLVLVEIVNVLLNVGLPLGGFNDAVGPFVTNGETVAERLTV